MTGWRDRVNALRMMHKTCCNNRPRERVDMNLMTRRPRVLFTNPHLISPSKQVRLCPLRGRPTLLTCFPDVL